MTGRIQLGRLGAFALILALLTPAGETEAQPARKNQRVVILSNEPSPALDGLRHGLCDLGYVEGREVTLEYVWAGPNLIGFPPSPRRSCARKWTSSSRGGRPPTCRRSSRRNTPLR